MLLAACGSESGSIDDESNPPSFVETEVSSLNTIGALDSSISDELQPAIETPTNDDAIADTDSADTDSQDNTAVDTVQEDGTTETETTTVANNVEPVTNDTEIAPLNTIGNLTLSPLPQPPLTSAPDAQDEPIHVSGPVSTVSEFFLVRDVGGIISDQSASAFSITDFEAGLQAPKITFPTGYDSTQNPAPFFEGLENTTVFAGETLELVLRPTDSDGTFPGMFPELVPSNAQYIDNFDRTKSVRWRPLQPDVGFHEMKFTAVDAAEPLYRAEYSVLIQVLLPDDQSGIENLAPGINRVRLHTARVNDPVVIEIKGTDPNGTVPTLEVLNQPPGATLVPHHTDPSVSVLRFVPSTTGTLSMDVIARDAINPNLTGNTTINIDVRAEADFLREGQRLRDMATLRDFRIGFASVNDFYYRADGAIYADTAAQEFNFVTPENDLKWSFLNPLPGRYRWASADNLVSYAKTHGLEVHGHTLVWYTSLPSWIQFSEVEDREFHMREFIVRVLERYADDIPVWDVVNEALEDDGTYRNSVWFEAMGEQFIDIAFLQARESAPNATLLYNDYDVSWNGPKSTAMFNMLQDLKDREIPVDGVGFQMHVFADFNEFDEVEANFQKAADMDLDIYVTELDVSMMGGQTETQQAEVYRRVLDICLDQPRCKGVQSWGFTDNHSWRRQYNPLILDAAYQVKPAYEALQQRLSEN